MEHLSGFHDRWIDAASKSSVHCTSSLHMPKVPLSDKVFLILRLWFPNKTQWISSWFWYEIEREYLMVACITSSYLRAVHGTDISNTWWAAPWATFFTYRSQVFRWTLQSGSVLIPLELVSGRYPSLHPGFSKWKTLVFPVNSKVGGGRCHPTKFRLLGWPRCLQNLEFTVGERHKQLF